MYFIANGRAVTASWLRFHLLYLRLFSLLVGTLNLTAQLSCNAISRYVTVLRIVHNWNFGRLIKWVWLTGRFWIILPSRQPCVACKMATRNSLYAHVHMYLALKLFLFAWKSWTPTARNNLLALEFPLYLNLCQHGERASENCSERFCKNCCPSALHIWVH